ncbi:MAG: histidine phosphatase family protein [Candidatus Micrarchaeota archaeon]
MATKVFLIRHCQSVANAERRYNCSIEDDEGLSEKGLEQAAQVARFFSGMLVGKVYSSPFLRTRQTSAAIADACGSVVEECDFLRELDCGHWNGRSEEEIMRDFPEVWRGWHYDPQNNPIPGGETLLEVQARALPEFERIVKRNRDETVVVVTHYCVFNVLLCSLVSSLANFRSFDTRNGTIAEIRMENVPRVEAYWNPTRGKD